MRPDRFDQIPDLPIADLTPHPRNYRDHPDDQLAHIEKSLREHGFYRPVVVAKDKTILAGHGLVMAATRMGLKSVPVVVLPIASDSPQAMKVLTGDNEIARLGEVDDRALTNMLRDVLLTDEDGLMGTGFDESMLSALVMVTRPASEIEDHDAAAEWVGMPDFEPADAPITMTIRFDSEDDRDAFIEHIGATVTKRGTAWSTWWPDREKADQTAVKFT